ncbi:MAG: hypothetical protein DWH80_09190 [Planctomycetota bacterium]|nr:MAG: hypothetical protein DWH80_09190 [Planctomycetota bacterium]
MTGPGFSREDLYATRESGSGLADTCLTVAPVVNVDTIGRSIDHSCKNTYRSSEKIGGFISLNTKDFSRFLIGQHTHFDFHVYS